MHFISNIIYTTSSYGGGGRWILERDVFLKFSLIVKYKHGKQ